MMCDNKDFIIIIINLAFLRPFVRELQKIKNYDKYPVLSIYTSTLFISILNDIFFLKIYFSINENN